MNNVKIKIDMEAGILIKAQILIFYSLGEAVITNHYLSDMGMICEIHEILY